MRSGLVSKCAPILSGSARQPDVYCLQRFTARFAKSWDHTYNTLYKGQRSGKTLVDFLVELLVKFTVISEAEIIDIASKASGNPIVAIFNKSRCKESEWPFWFIWISSHRIIVL